MYYLRLQLSKRTEKMPRALAKDPALIHITKIVRKMRILMNSLIALHETMHPSIFRVDRRCVLQRKIFVNEINSLFSNNESPIIRTDPYVPFSKVANPRKTPA